jgi:ABC-2 type transport system ATP-binding protein
LDEAEDFCNHIAIIDDGRLITQGATNELIKENNCNSVEEVYLKITGQVNKYTSIHLIIKNEIII